MNRIREIEVRAGAINLSMHQLCIEAKVSEATFWRMRGPNANPKVKTLEKVLSKLEGHLDKKETAIGRALARRRDRARPAA